MSVSLKTSRENKYNMVYTQKKSLNNYLEKSGITYWGVKDERSIPLLIANTYIFDTSGKTFVLDSGMGSKRAEELKKFLLGHDSYDIINTHAHEDHFLNNSSLMKTATVIHLSHLSKRWLDKNIRYVIENVRTMWETMDVRGLMMRYLKLSLFKATLLSIIIKTMPGLMSSIMVGTQYKSSKYYKELNKNDLVINYMVPAQQKKFNWGELSFMGWEINDNLIALETPGHTRDSLSWYLKDRNAIFIGDIDFFLNPSNITDGSISTLHDSIKKIIDLVKIEQIEFLGSGHYLPVVGTERIISYLESYLRKQKEVYDQLSMIIAKKISWKWRELINEVFNVESIAVKKAIDVDYPRSASYIDIYLYLLLVETGYRYTQGAWLRQSDGIDN